MGVTLREVRKSESGCPAENSKEIGIFVLIYS